MVQVLVLGGCGMLGRNFVTYLVENKLADAIRVADKRMSMMSYFNPRHEEAFEKSGIVEELQVDLSIDKHVDNAFKRDSGTWDYVFHFAAENSMGLDDAVYAQKTVGSATKCGAKAAADGCTAFVYCSSGAVYKSQTKLPAPESGKTAPIFTPAKFQLQAEEALRAVDKLPLVVVRPALIYGSADVAGLMPLLVVGSTYKYTNDKMQLLWDKHVRRNTVHVDDASAACWFLASNLVSKSLAGKTFNLADSANSTQGTLLALVGEIFGIKTSFLGKIASNMARIAMDTVVKTANDNHLRPWMQMCKESGIRNTPLTPFMHKELLGNSHIYVDGTAITALGFKYKHAKPTVEALKACIQEYATQKLFPVSDTVLPEMLKATAATAAAGDADAATGAAAGGGGAGGGAGAS